MKSGARYIERVVDRLEASVAILPGTELDFSELFMANEEIEVLDTWTGEVTRRPRLPLRPVEALRAAAMEKLK